MYQDFRDSFLRWGNTTTERQKLQYIYLILIVIVILFAGIVSLVKANWGHDLTYIALVALSVFIINAVVWHLLNSVILSRLPTKPRKK